MLTQSMFLQSRYIGLWIPFLAHACLTHKAFNKWTFPLISLSSQSQEHVFPERVEPLWLRERVYDIPCYDPKLWWLLCPFVNVRLSLHSRGLWPCSPHDCQGFILWTSKFLINCFFYKVPWSWSYYNNRKTNKSTNFKVMYTQAIRKCNHLQCCSIPGHRGMIHLLSIHQNNLQNFVLATWDKFHVFRILKYIMVFMEPEQVRKTWF